MKKKINQLILLIATFSVLSVFFASDDSISLSVINFSNIFQLVIKILDKLSRIIISLKKTIEKNYEKTIQTGNLKIKDIEYNPLEKNYKITINNDNNLIGVKLFESIWNTLNTLDVWKSIDKKIIMISLYSAEENKTYNVHRNVIITQNTTFNDYYNSIKKIVDTFADWYSRITYNEIVITIWPIVQERGKYRLAKKKFELVELGKKMFHTSALTSQVLEQKLGKNKVGNISMLKKSGKKKIGVICTLDVETISINSVQVPIAVSFCYRYRGSYHPYVFSIDKQLLKKDKNSAIKKLWTEVFDKIKKLKISYQLFIYSHNLGGFDGYFILPELYSYSQNDFNNVKPLIDDQNKFISINYEYHTKPYLELNETKLKDKGLTEVNREDVHSCKWTFLDSYRLFPISLNKFCETFNVKGKLSDYNTAWNKIDLLDDRKEFSNFLKYSKQDSIALLKAIHSARTIYLDKYNVDIVNAVSAPSLSMLIFRHKFQNIDIPILNRKLDATIRDSYFGGSSDYFKFYGENLHYYDINSLYPYAMLNDMPFNYLGEFDGDSMPLKDIFGFVEVEVECPDSIKTPLLAYRHDGKVLHPTGRWRGIYFSEEIKEILKHGYDIKILKIYQFTREKLFSNYIDHFYKSKKDAVDPSNRYIAKLHLNSLYGMFGRKPNTLKTIAIKPTDEAIYDIISKYPIKAKISINENLMLFLIHNNLSFDIINTLKVEINPDILQQTQQIVKANIAIASAITSYARIVMMKYKTLPGIIIYYTDTDSIFTNLPLPDYLIGKDIGMMKDELNGGLIKKAYFFGIKKYAYIDNNDNVKSVFSGVPRNSLSWDEIEQIALNNTISTKVPDQFLKYLSKFQISIKPKIINIKFLSDKKLIDNDYQPIKIFKGNNFRFFDNYLIRKIWGVFKRFTK